MFLYVLMRDHLPTGTVKFLIDQAQRAGDPVYSAPELEQLAERYAAELLLAPPREDVDAEEEPPSAPPPLPPTASGDGASVGAAPGEAGRELADRGGASASEGTAIAAPKTSQGNELKPVSAEIQNRTLAWINAQGGRAIKPKEIDEGAGISKVTRSRVITQLANEGKIRAEGQRAGRRVFAITTSQDATRVRGAGKSYPAGAGEKPVDDEAGESPAPPSPPPAPDPPPPPPFEDAELMARATRLLDEADGEVWPRDFEAALGISSTKRLLLVEKLKGAGKLVIAGSGGPRVRYRSSKKRRTAPPPTPRRSGGGEAAEPLGGGKVHLQDRTAERQAEATAAAKADEREAAEVLPSVREWARGGGTFTARQLRDVFDIEPSVCTRVIAALTKEKSIEATGLQGAGTYHAITAMNGNGNDGGRRDRGKRSLDGGGNERATLESRALGALDGDGRTLDALASHLGVSIEVARKVVGKLYREGDIRSRSRGGDVHYAAVA